MSCFIFRLSRRHRFILALTFTIMNIMQVFLGVCTAGWSIYVCISVSHNLYSEKAEITFVFTVTCMYGTHVIIHYLIGIKISEKCFNKAHKRSTKKQLIFWILAGCNIILNILVIALLTATVSKHIVRSMRHSLEKGMRVYLKDNKWKQMIDRLQIDWQCCGINDYRDWHNISWIDTFHVNTDSRLVKEMRLTKDLLHFPVTPWSCCRLDFPMQCLHDPFQQIQSSHLWKEQPDFVLESINTDGCLNVIKQPIEMSLVGFMLVGSCIVILQILIIMVARLVYTSSRNAIVLRDPYGYSPGWIFSKNFCASTNNRTLSNIMLELDRHEKLAGEEQERLIESRKQTEQNPNTATTTEVKTNPSPMRPVPSPKKKPARNEGQQHKRRSYEPPDSTRDSEHDPISSADEDALMIGK